MQHDPRLLRPTENLRKVLRTSCTGNVNVVPAEFESEIRNSDIADFLCIIMYGVGVYLCVLVHLYPTQGPERPCVTRIAHPLYPG